MRDICDEELKYIGKGLTSARIFETKNGKIIKSIPIKNNREYDNIKFIKNIDDNIKPLFANILEFKKCGNFNYYLMDKFTGDINHVFLKNIDLLYRKNILLQILLGVTYMNYKLGLYHNDLYFKKEIRNVMYLNINYNKHIKFDDIELICEKYLSKIIDFGWMANKPLHRTLEYYIKYFKNISIVSEPLLFVYFYFITIKKDDDIYNDKLLNYLKKIANVIQYYLKSNNKLTELNFNKLLYRFIAKYYNNLENI